MATKRILELKNDQEARLLSEILHDEDIPHVVVSYHDSAYDGIFQTQQGWGHLEAPAEHEQTILDIYEDLGKGLVIDDDET